MRVQIAVESAKHMLDRNRGCTSWTLKHSCDFQKHGMWSASEMAFSFDYAMAWLGHIHASVCAEMVWHCDVLNTCLSKVYNIRVLLWICSPVDRWICFQLLQMKKHFLEHMVCVLLLLQHCQELVLTSLPEIPRKAELPVKILEGVSEWMK